MIRSFYLAYTETKVLIFEKESEALKHSTIVEKVTLDTDELKVESEYINPLIPKGVEWIPYDRMRDVK